MVGKSRGFGFARFTTVEMAKRFLADHYPSVRLFGENQRVKVAFSRTGGEGGGGEKERGGRGRGREGDEEWTCLMVSIGLGSKLCRWLTRLAVVHDA